MVLKGTGVRGDEQTGLEGTVANAASLGSAIGTVAGALLNGARDALKPQFQEPPALTGALHQSLYQAFVDKGVSEEVATEAADGLVLGQDAKTNPAIAEANRIVSGVERDPVDTAQVPEAESKTEAKEEQPDKDEQPSEGARTKAAIPAVQPVSLQNQNGSSRPQKVEAPSQPVEQSQTTFAEPPKSAQQIVDTPAAKSTPEAEATSVPQPPQNSTSTQRVEFSQQPSEMKWADLLGKASEITSETGTKPQSRKKADVLEFVENYRSEQKSEKAVTFPDTEQAAKPKEHYASTTVSAPVFRTPIVPDPTPSLAEGYVAGFKAADVDSRVATEASTDLVSGKDVNTSAAIKAANKQAQPPRSALHQMYFEVLAKQGLQPELAEKASKDLAEGKGALSSDSVRQAHDKILNRELKESTALSPSQRRWHQHSRHVTGQDPEKRIKITAKNAAAAGLSQKDIENMLIRNSPDVAKMQAKEGGSYTANYIRSTASRAIQNSKAKGQGRSVIKQKSQGVEV